MGEDPSKRKVYKFDRVFEQDSTQEDVYNGLKLPHLVGKVVEVSNTIKF
jgi:hypothetical protein